MLSRVIYVATDGPEEDSTGVSEGFIPPPCQKPPAPFCLLSLAADHSETDRVNVRPRRCGTLRKGTLAPYCLHVH